MRLTVIEKAVLALAVVTVIGFMLGLASHQVYPVKPCPSEVQFNGLDSTLSATDGFGNEVSPLEYELTYKTGPNLPKQCLTGDIFRRFGRIYVCVEADKWKGLK